MAGPITPAIWYQALASEIGVILQTDDPNRARQKLYELRKELKDPDLDSIIVKASPTNPNQDLWLVKRKPNAPEGDISPREGDVEPSAG